MEGPFTLSLQLSHKGGGGGNHPRRVPSLRAPQAQPWSLEHQG